MLFGFPAFRDLVSFFLGVHNKAPPPYNDDDDDDDDDDVAMGGVGFSVVFHQILNFFLLFSFFFFKSLRKKNLIPLFSLPLPVFTQKKQNFLQPNLHNNYA